jgi:hypothetical protein
MSKEKAILLLEEKGYYGTPMGYSYWFTKKAESCDFYCQPSEKGLFFQCDFNGYIRFSIDNLNYSFLSENSISSLENSAILSSKIVNTFHRFRCYCSCFVIRKERWRIRRVVSNNGFTHKFMLDAKYGIRWTKYKEITTQNIEELYALVTAL